MAKLNDEKKKHIIADYVVSQNYSEVARKHGVSRTTVANVVAADEESCEKLQEKKEQNTLEMLAYLDSRKEKAQLFIDKCMDELLSDGRLKSARVSEITTAMGTTIDKFMLPPNVGGDKKSTNLLDAIRGQAKDIYTDEGKG